MRITGYKDMRITGCEDHRIYPISYPVMYIELIELLIISRKPLQHSNIYFCKCPEESASDLNWRQKTIRNPIWCAIDSEQNKLPESFNAAIDSEQDSLQEKKSDGKRDDFSLERHNLWLHPNSLT